MQGVITAIVAFIFVCIVFPSLVKNRPQFYAALFLVLLAIFLDAVAGIFKPDSGFRTFVSVADAFLVIGAILLLVLLRGRIGDARPCSGYWKDDRSGSKRRRKGDDHRPAGREAFERGREGLRSPQTQIQRPNSGSISMEE